MTVTCAVGKVMIGGGGSTNLPGEVAVSSYPANSGSSYDQWTAQGTEALSNVNGNWTVTVFGICATP